MSAFDWSDYEDDDVEGFLGDDDWEDSGAIEKIKAQHPGWLVVKVTNFTENTLSDVKSWCANNCMDEYEHVGWYSSCSYTVGVAFKTPTDAIMFKLIWGTK